MCTPQPWLPASHCWFLWKLSRAGSGQSLDRRPDGAGRGVGEPVGGSHPPGLCNIPNAPGQRRGAPSFGWDVKTEVLTRISAPCTHTSQLHWGSGTSLSLLPIVWSSYCNKTSSDQMLKNVIWTKARPQNTLLTRGETTNTFSSGCVSKAEQKWTMAGVESHAPF